MLTLLNLLSAVTLLIWGTHIVRTGILRVYGSNLRHVSGRNMSKRWLAFIAGILVTAMVVPMMPYFLSFAAGAMLYVVVEELIPEMSEGEHSDIGVLSFAVGFMVMMALDVALG